MRKADLNSVEAGEYEIVAPYWDEIKSKPGQPFDYVRHRRGATVNLNVEQARRLVYAGAVVKPGAADEVEQPGQETSQRPGVPAEEQEVVEPAVVEPDEGPAPAPVQKKARGGNS